jgi:hypothetical protein
MKLMGRGGPTSSSELILVTPSSNLYFGEKSSLLYFY